jgi:hypothetical protein
MIKIILITARKTVVAARSYPSHDTSGPLCFHQLCSLRSHGPTGHRTSYELLSTLHPGEPQVLLRDSQVNLQEQFQK